MSSLRSLFVAGERCDPETSPGLSWLLGGQVEDSRNLKSLDGKGLDLKKLALLCECLRSTLFVAFCDPGASSSQKPCRRVFMTTGGKQRQARPQN